jgi:DNA-binding XRE family transcriptional regulator
MLVNLFLLAGVYKYMILNPKDLSIADARIRILKSNCDYLRRRIADPREALITRLEIEKIETRITELQQQINSYLKLNSTNHFPLFPIPIHRIPHQLIELRLAAQVTQAELAKELGTTRFVIARYERSRYAGVSLKRLIQIDALLRQKLSQKVFTRANNQDLK